MSDDDLPEVMIPPLRTLLVERKGPNVRLTLETLSEDESEELVTLLCDHIRAGAVRLTFRHLDSIVTIGGRLN